MTTQEFFNKWNGRKLENDGAYLYQCVDLAKEYVRDVFGVTPFSGNGKDFEDNYPKDKLQFVRNTPSGIPPFGALIVWGEMPNNPYGHVGVFVSGGTSSFQSFDQNWPVGSGCHYQNHNWNNVRGWLVRKNTGTTKTVTASTLNVRADASTSARVVGSRKYGDEITVLGTKAGTNVNGNTTWLRLGYEEYISEYWTR